MSDIQHFTPLLKCLTVGKSEIDGLGIIATVNIKVGEDLGISHVIDNEYKDGLIRTPLGGFLNHSDNPNCKYQIDGKKLRLITQRDISKGAEITASYRGWYRDEVLDTYK